MKVWQYILRCHNPLTRPPIAESVRPEVTEQRRQSSKRRTNKPTNPDYVIKSVTQIIKQPVMKSINRPKKSPTARDSMLAIINKTCISAESKTVLKKSLAASRTGSKFTQELATRVTRRARNAGWNLPVNMAPGWARRLDIFGVSWRMALCWRSSPGASEWTQSTQAARKGGRTNTHSEWKTLGNEENCTIRT